MTVVEFPTAEPVDVGDLAPEFSDDALALEFSARHAGELRFVAGFGKWMRWDGVRWVMEKTLASFDLARAVARDFANACNQEKLKRRIASANTVAGIERLARSDRRHAATVSIWDADPWLLNTPDGIVDLRSGAMQSHDPLRYMTKMTAVGPSGECERWRQFLREITNNDEELQAFLQRIAGYALTGSTCEHALFFLYGTGRNGKGVFLNTLSAILSDYAAVAPMETFIATQGERHPTDLAGLRGARLVSAQETEEGRRWAESKIKALTGGDPITARFMRQDFFTFEPQFKLLIAGNHKPGLRGVDEAIRARFNLVPFTVTIPKEKRDKTLAEKLRKEWPGIMQWAIAGCLAWQSEGLHPPKIVRDATEDYLGEEDAIARWIEDCCVTGANHWCASGDLWQSWKQWGEANNERVGSQKSLGSALDGHGYLRQRNETGMRGYQGLKLKPGIDLNDTKEQPPENG
jgi:putative DNA primase/helicase